MQKHIRNEQGFIPLLLVILAVVVGVIVFVYMRVSQAS